MCLLSVGCFPSSWLGLEPAPSSCLTGFFCSKASHLFFLLQNENKSPNPPTHKKYKKTPQPSPNKQNPNKEAFALRSRSSPCFGGRLRERHCLLVSMGLPGSALVDSVGVPLHSSRFCPGNPEGWLLREKALGGVCQGPWRQSK